MFPCRPRRQQNEGVRLEKAVGRSSVGTWKKPAPLAKDWLFERINDGSGRTAVTDLRALSLGLIAGKQEVEKF
jgi:hypothetical protein